MMKKSSHVFVSNNIRKILPNVLVPINRLKRIIIKINMVSPYVLLSMTPCDIVKELIKYIRNLGFTGEILIAEGSAGCTWDGFKNGNFTKIAKQYDVELFDIHEDNSVEVPIFNKNFEEFYIPVSKTLINAEYLISTCRAKTHDTVIVTLSIKNLAVGGIVGVNNRPKIHQGYAAINFNIALLAAIMYPDLAIVDGRIGMEGNGPVSGAPKKWGWIFVGENPLEVDSVVAKCMGFVPKNIGYLYYLSKLRFGKIENIQLIGADFSRIKTKFRPHVTYEKQLKWKVSLDLENQLIERIAKIVSKFPRGKKHLLFS